MLADRLAFATKVDFSALVPEYVRDELLDGSILDTLTDLQDSVNYFIKFDMLKYFFHKFHSLDNHVTATVALSMYLLELVESKHHSYNDEPDLFFVVQNLLGVVLDQFE